MRVHDVTLSIVIGIAFVGCANKVPTPTASAPPAAPGISFDGTYRGAVQITGTASSAPRSWCETPNPIMIQVSGNTMNYAMPHPNVMGNPTPTFAVPIAQDGSFQGQASAGGSITGQINGSRMTGTISGVGCAYSLSADRS